MLTLFPGRPDTRACPEWRNHRLAPVISPLFNFTDVESFDSQVQSYIGSSQDQADLNHTFQCSNATYTGQGRRYFRSMLCSTLIASTQNVFNCYRSSSPPRTVTIPNTNTPTAQSESPADSNKKNVKRGPGPQSHRRGLEPVPSPPTPVDPGYQLNRTDLPPPLCQQSCMDYVHSLVAVVNSPEYCADSSTFPRLVIMQQQANRCREYPFNGTEANCVRGYRNEHTTCGYESLADQCAHCAAVRASGQCPSVTASDDWLLPTGIADLESFDRSPRALEAKAWAFRTAAIVLGVILGVTLLLLGIIYFMRRRRHRTTPSMDFLSSKPSFLGPPGSLDPNMTHDTNKALHSPANQAGNPGSGSRRSLPLGTLSRLMQLREIFSRRVDSESLDSSAALRGQERQQLFNVDNFIRSVGRNHVAVFAFFARQDDELTIHSGDEIEIQMAYSDGWAVGYNQRTSECGMFPLTCLFHELPSCIPAPWTFLSQRHSLQPPGTPMSAPSQPATPGTEPAPTATPLTIPTPAMPSASQTAPLISSRSQRRPGPQDYQPIRKTTYPKVPYQYAETPMPTEAVALPHHPLQASKVTAAVAAATALTPKSPLSPRPPLLNSIRQHDQATTAAQVPPALSQGTRRSPSALSPESSISQLMSFHSVITDATAPTSADTLSSSNGSTISSTSSTGLHSNPIKRARLLCSVEPPRVHTVKRHTRCQSMVRPVKQPTTATEEPDTRPPTARSE
ncbi:hypothetical protein H4R34_000767 [Dimargaris verticillata]|uniref:SH3 domain-containing protein n=1 Tax=Dimargaris verticillata TaxID=2761393 RepID=A0A9W8B7G4_9FUNG|nr:hypothetical protein H4R34_000767 [Dimargaris verticillata]